MRYTVRHETNYSYSAPVALGPHRLRLTPRGGRVLSRNLIVEPPPFSRTEGPDAYGNLVADLTFAGETRFLRVDSLVSVDTDAPPPPTAAPGLPWTPPGPDLAAFAPPEEIDPRVQAFAQELLTETGAEALAFLDRLNQRLFHRTDGEFRLEGEAQEPEETLATARGACRDLTVLFMAVCRSLQIPARFVSGYQSKAAAPDGVRQLHAWPEVHIPGVGWRGYDPTYGTPVGEEHIALAAAPTQAETMAVEGGFVGSAAATLTYRVWIETDD